MLHLIRAAPSASKSRAVADTVGARSGLQNYKLR